MSHAPLVPASGAAYGHYAENQIRIAKARMEKKQFEEGGLMNRFTRSERGSGVAGTIVLIAIVVVGVFVAYRYVIFKTHEMAMKDLVKNRADYASTYTDEQITTDIVQRAHDYNILIERDSVYIHREPGNTVAIRVPYDDSLDLILKKFYYHYDLKESAPLPR